MIRIRMLGWMLLGLSALASPAWAQEAPDALVKRVAEDVLTQIRSDKELQAGNQAKVKQIIETKLVPHFDFARMTALAMGRNWRTATPEQQKQLTDQFRTLLVRTYSGALANYRDNTMDYKPLRMNPGDTEVTVRTEVRRHGSGSGADRLQHGKDRRRLEGLRRHRRRREPGHQLSRRIQRYGQEFRYRRTDRHAGKEECAARRSAHRAATMQRASASLAAGRRRPLGRSRAR